MPAVRRSIPDFALANPVYAGATVAFYTVDVDGAATATKATLYEAMTGDRRLPNPQKLDSEGKFRAPVYIDAPVIADITSLRSQDLQTGVIQARGTWRGQWESGTVYYATDFVQNIIVPNAAGMIYVVLDDYEAGASIDDDIADGHLQLAFDLAEFNGVPGAAGVAYWVGDASTTAFALPPQWASYASALSLMAFWDGGHQYPNSYTIGGGNITFATAPPYGTLICARNQTLGPPGPGDVTGPASSAANAIAAYNDITGKVLRDNSAGDTLVTGLKAASATGVTLKNASGAAVVTLGASGSDDATFADDVAVTGDLAVTGTTTTAASTRSAPGLVIGPSGGGLYKGGPAVGTFQPMIGFSLDTNRALEMGYVNTSDTAGALVRPGAAPTSISNGISFRIEGGPGGSTSGRGGALNLFGGAVIDGDGAGVFRIGTNGVGVNRTGGGIGDTCGNGTGTAAGGDYTVQAGAGDAGRGGNATISGGNSTSSVAGGFTIRTGTGAAVDGNIDNRTPGSLLFRTDSTARWRINGSAAGNAGAFEPSTDNAWSVGSGGARPTEYFGASGMINTSDITLKNVDANAFPDPLALLNAIDPIAYRWIEGRKVQIGMRQVGEKKVGEEQIGEEPTGQFEDVIVIAGVKADGTPDLSMQRREVMRPIMRDVMEPIYEPIFESRPGTRVHLGFSAQQVREALGSAKYAMWTLDDPSDPNSRQGLRTDQIIPVLWKIAKISRTEVDELRATVATLLARIEVLEAAR